jgi:carboxymethylenebutenolidase
MLGQMVEFPSNGSTAQGYLAPATGGSGPAVIVIQEWWGLVDPIEAVADRFAAEGFTALAPDLYHGESTTSPDDAGRLMMALNIGRSVQDLLGAVDYLLAHDAVAGTQLGTVGFCMGGQLALASGCKSAKVGAVVDFYGVHPNVTLDFSGLAAPVLGLFAERDGFVTPEVARKLRADVTSAGKRMDIHIYEGADHGFFNDTREDVYDAGAAADAWNRTLTFLRGAL